MQGCYEGALRLTIADSMTRRGAPILPCVRGVIFATEPLSFMCFGSESSCRSAAPNEQLLDIGGARCAMWLCVLSASVDALGSGMAVASHLLAVVEPINDTVIAVKERAAAYSGVQLGRSAVAQYMPPLSDCVRDQDARRPDAGFAWRRPSHTAISGRHARPLLSGNRRDAEKGLAIALPADSSSFPAT